MPTSLRGADGPVLNILAGLPRLSYSRRNIRGVRSALDLATGPDFTIAAVTCRDDHTGWSETEAHDGYNVVLVRCGRALDRLERGERSLGILAADLGFADQAHLCRTVRQHLGHTPTALRRLLDPHVPSPQQVDPS